MPASVDPRRQHRVLQDYQFRTRGNSPPDSFDLLIEAGEDIRKLPLHLRKASLARLFARRVDGIFLSDFEQGEIGPRFRYVTGANRAIVRSESA
jgi:ATP-dependent DNA ligase